MDKGQQDMDHGLGPALLTTKVNHHDDVDTNEVQNNNQTFPPMRVELFKTGMKSFGQ